MGRKNYAIPFPTDEPLRDFPLQRRPFPADANRTRRGFEAIASPSNGPPMPIRQIDLYGSSLPYSGRARHRKIRRGEEPNLGTRKSAGTARRIRAAMEGRPAMHTVRAAKDPADRIGPAVRHDFSGRSDAAFQSGPAYGQTD